MGIEVVTFDVTERKEAEEFRSVVMDNMAEGLYALDAEGLADLHEPAAASMLGWTEDELRGKLDARDRPLPAGRREEFRRRAAPLQVRTQAEAVRILDDAYTRKDGSIFPVAYSAAPLRTAATLQGVVVVFRDITERRRNERARANESSTPSPGSDASATRSTRTGSSSTPSPSCRLADGRPGEELLLRMIGRDNEVILPGSFLPVAEKYGLIGEIDRWVITQATRLAATGRRVIEANLSAASIGTSDLLPFIDHRSGKRTRRPGQPRLRDHRDRAHARHRPPAKPSPAGWPNSAAGWPSTTSAPASAASPTSRSCPSPT